MASLLGTGIEYVNVVWELIWGFMNLMTIHTCCITHCAKKEKCEYFMWWLLERTDFNNGAVFERGVTKVIDHKLLNALQNKVEELKIC